LVCDLPFHGLIDDNLCPEKDPTEAILHVLCLSLEAIFMKKFTDLVVNSPRTAARRMSIWDSLEKRNARGVCENEQRSGMA
jgi:hypothetical protein